MKRFNLYLNRISRELLQYYSDQFKILWLIELMLIAFVILKLVEYFLRALVQERAISTLTLLWITSNTHQSISFNMKALLWIVSMPIILMGIGLLAYILAKATKLPPLYFLAIILCLLGMLILLERYHNTPEVTRVQIIIPIYFVIWIINFITAWGILILSLRIFNLLTRHSYSEIKMWFVPGAGIGNIIAAFFFVGWLFWPNCYMNLRYFWTEPYRTWLAALEAIIVACYFLFLLLEKRELKKVLSAISRSGRLFITMLLGVAFGAILFGLTFM